jgi:hypothetical protein
VTSRFVPLLLVQIEELNVSSKHLFLSELHRKAIGTKITQKNICSYQISKPKKKSKINTVLDRDGLSWSARFDRDGLSRGYFHPFIKLLYFNL